VSGSAAEAVIARIRAVYARWGRTTGIEEMRRDWEALHAPDASVPAAVPVSADGVAAAWIGREGLRRDRAILFFHGGGFQMGSVETHRALAAVIADGAGCRVFSVNYRLAPEHRFPAPVEDALAAWHWLAAAGLDARRIALAGDSAGGGLALSLMLALKGRGRALPAAAALMSPWTDMEASGASYETRAAADPFHQRATIRALARTYLGRGGDPRDPLASPIMGDLTGLPPLLIQVGERETVLDDSRVLAERASAAGVEAKLEIWPGMFHVFQLYPELAEARAAVAAIGAHLARHLE
jgi:acetyl esterase/lipase